jgi:repressor LexA
MHADQLSCDLVFAYVRDYIEEHGYPPSMRNIAQACQLSTTAVRYNLDKLEAWGWLAREPHVARSLRILQKPNRGRGKT